MNLKDLCETRGAHLYYGMSAQQYLDAVGSVLVLQSVYADYSVDTENAQLAIDYVAQCEQDLKDAKMQLEDAITQLKTFQVTLNKDVDAYHKQIQTTGSFLGDGPSLGPVTPQQPLITAYNVIVNHNDVENFRSQLEEVVPAAQKTVEEKEALLAEAKQIELDTVRTCIYKLLTLSM